MNEKPFIPTKHSMTNSNCDEAKVVNYYHYSLDTGMMLVLSIMCSINSVAYLIIFK